jgi:hypothetical protein
LGRLERAIDSGLVAPGLVQISGISPNDSPRTSTVSLRVRLLSAQRVHWLTRRLVWLMPDGMWFWAALAATVGIAFVVTARAATPAVGAPTAIRLTAFALMVLSTVAHELGHATACTKSGARCGEIGFGMYWYFPVLFTNLDDVWRLNRWERARVDAAGLFFQSGFIALAAFVIARNPGGRAALHGLPTLLSIAVIYTLNPLLRFDGYWLLCDLSGVPNLRAASQHALHGLFARRRMPPTSHDSGAHALDLGARARTALAIYAGASAAFGGLLAVIGVRLIARWLAAGAPRQIESAATAVQAFARNENVWLALSTSVRMIELTLPAAIAVFLFVGSMRSTRAFVRRVVS